ncbi:MAG: hypothetical protein E6J63_12620 [Deltaproteobacteria bacterium]|nr:MAG: hypothetical protein E6J63_12620 [Deltaproteobacteria bacterium]
MPATLHCTFCGRSGLEAEKIIAGPPPFFICDSCVGAYSEAAREEAIALHDRRSPDRPPSARTCGGAGACFIGNGHKTPAHAGSA